MGEKKKILVIDSGALHVGTAHSLAKEGHDVCYYNSYFSPYVKFQDFAPGVGIPGVTKLYDFADHLDSADCIVFPDVGMGDLASSLRERGYSVFGAGKAEILEQDRGKSVEILNGLGIKTPVTHVVKGVPAALEKLAELLGQKNETNQNATGKCFVKFNVFRGSIDSFPVANMEEAEFMFDSVKAAFGPYSQSIDVIIQQTVEGLECGADLFFNGEEFLSPGMIGFESGGNYVGKMTDDMSIYKADLEKLKPYLKENNYRGAFSFECFYDGTDCHWFDICCRFPMPLGLLYSVFSGSLGELICGVADGTMSRAPFETGNFLGCMEVQSEEGLSRYLPLKAGKDTRFMHYMMEGDKMYGVPGVSMLGVVCGQGSSLEEVEQAIQKESESLSVFFAMFNTKFIEKIREDYLEPMLKFGFDFEAGTTQKTIKEPVEPKKSAPKPPKEEYPEIPGLDDEPSKSVDSTESVDPMLRRVAAKVVEKKKSALYCEDIDRWGVPIGR